MEGRSEYLVELKFPAQPQMLFLARMIASSVASHANFPNEQVEDVRLAVDELVLGLVGGFTTTDTARAISVLIRWDEDSIEVEALLDEDASSSSSELTRATGAQGEMAQEFSRSILGAVVDQHGPQGASEHGYTTPTAWLRIHRRVLLG